MKPRRAAERGHGKKGTTDVFRLALSLILAGGREQPKSRLAVIKQAPDFTLVNQDGKTVKFSDSKGKVRLVSFIFTTCNGACPATTHRMAKIAELAKTREDAFFGRLTSPYAEMLPMQFVSVTLDPQRDSPDALKQYTKLYGLELRREITRPLDDASFSDKPGKFTSWFRWDFLTGTPDTVQKTIDAWGMWVKPAPNGQLDHPSRIFLVDQQNRIREIYNVDLLRPQDVLEDVAELLREEKK